MPYTNILQQMGLVTMPHMYIHLERRNRRRHFAPFKFSSTHFDIHNATAHTPSSSMSFCSSEVFPGGATNVRGAVPGPRKKTSWPAAGGLDRFSADCHAAADATSPS